MTAIVRIDDSASFLASLDQAKRYLAACSRFDEVKDLRDKSEALRVWAKAKGDARELEVAAGELGVLASLRMAELLPPKAIHGGAGGGSKSEIPRGDFAPPAREANRLRTLADLGRPTVEKKVEEIKARGDVPRRATIVREVTRERTVAQSGGNIDAGELAHEVSRRLRFKVKSSKSGVSVALWLGSVRELSSVQLSRHECLKLIRKDDQ